MMEKGTRSRLRLVPAPAATDTVPDAPDPASGLALYGLATCGTCRKACNWLDRFGIAYRFIDYRAEPVPSATLKAWAAALGGWEKLVNKGSPTWRNLLPQRQHPASDPEWTLLLKEHPNLMRRPVVVRADGSISVGFGDHVFKRLFGK